MENKQTILIVDDFVDNLNVAASYLLKENLNVILAQNGKDALFSAEDMHPDLILLDVMMPDIDGFQVCTKLKANEKTKDIPIIFLSAINDTANIVRGFDMGGADFISKPFIVEELIARVKTHLSLYKQKKELFKTKKSLIESEAKLSSVINSIPNLIFYKDLEGYYTGVNDAYATFLGKEKNDIVGKKDIDFLSEEDTKTFIDIDETIKKTKENHSYEEWTVDADGNEIYLDTIKAPLINTYKDVIGVVGISRNISKLKLTEKDLNEKNNHLNLRNEEIISSIRYAKTIQKSILPTQENLDLVLKDSFVLYKPKDLVGGDFYFVNKIKNKIHFTVADASGHGVPGGFLSMLGIMSIHEKLNKDKDSSPKEILEHIRKSINSIFDTSEMKNSNSIDMAFCTIDINTNILQYSGAYNPLWIIRDNEIIEYKATRDSVGFSYIQKQFENHTIQLKENDKLYLFSDGYKDQFGGKNLKKFNTKRFKDLILKISNHSINEQKQILFDVLNKWQGKEEQVDDVTIMGIHWQKR